MLPLRCFLRRPGSWRVAGSRTPVENVVGTAILQAPQGRVETARTNQIVVSASLANLAAFENDDFIGVSNGRQAVRYD